MKTGHAPKVFTVHSAIQKEPPSENPGYGLVIERDVTSVVLFAAILYPFCMEFIEEIHVFETSRVARTWRMCKI